MKIILNKGDVQHEAPGNRIRGSVQKEDVLYPISFERYSALGQLKKNWVATDPSEEVSASFCLFLYSICA